MPARETSGRRTVVVGEDRPSIWQYLRGYRKLSQIQDDLEANPSKFDQLKSAVGRAVGSSPQRAHVLIGPGRCEIKGHRPISLVNLPRVAAELTGLYPLPAWVGHRLPQPRPLLGGSVAGAPRIAADGKEPTRRAQIECAEFLVEMLKIGWGRTDMDMLESLWWKYRDHRGRLSERSDGPQARHDEAVNDKERR